MLLKGKRLLLALLTQTLADCQQYAASASGQLHGRHVRGNGAATAAPQAPGQGRNFNARGRAFGSSAGQALTGSLSCFHLRLVNICKNHRRQQRGSGHPVRYRFSGWRAPGL